VYLDVEYNRRNRRQRNQQQQQTGKAATTINTAAVTVTKCTRNNSNETRKICEKPGSNKQHAKLKMDSNSNQGWSSRLQRKFQRIGVKTKKKQY